MKSRPYFLPCLSLALACLVLLLSPPAAASGDPIGGPDSGILNFLLVGRDLQEDGGGARSDSMILCTFHEKTGRLTLTSFLRDLYLPIPGHGSNRINAAYALGGMDLLRQTLHHNFDLHIDGTVEVDFSQFSGIIDLLGGVSVELRRDEARTVSRRTGTTVAEGLQTLTGQQALVYARIRTLDADGDASRTRRQQKLIRALVDRCRDLELTEAVRLITRVLPLVTTDMGNGQLLRHAMQVLPHLRDIRIVHQQIPSTGTYRDRIIGGMAVLETDLDAAREFLRQKLLAGA